MKINPGQLGPALEKSLAPVYLVSGDEPLLVQEACDQIRTRARGAGFNDRQVYYADQHLNWGAVRDELSAMSLFAEQRRIEIHLPTGKLGDGRDVIEQALIKPADDILLLLISARLDAAETKRKWYKQLQKAGVHVTVWPIDPDKFGGWLQQRARSRGLTLTQGALNLLAERLEGNLLAASQELDRLELLTPDKTINEDVVEDAVQYSARFNIFEVITDLLAGRAAHAQKVIATLRQEGENPLGLLAMLVRDINMTLALQQAMKNREVPGTFLKKNGVFQPQRARAIEQAARRLNTPQLHQALNLCSNADRAAKGFGDLPPWHHLSDLATLLRQ
ncbi:DNA polymerase III subunit delta [Marinobacter zhanjiangensis]|uniref:DNA polymerase III subunit delta n=1 Tax=Marinobacter zhanjiangensis TaxID=578215 RepID=A0ABQ3B2C1_9GAMM|nr:DNA polymerase III subunit delta [Marinobacter zhanjiangensis]GGY75793.1 DNA polymerase III subunit delta [Marinobacter zhanjiangensis]